MELYYKKDTYVADGSIAIQTYAMDEEFGMLEPYGMATVCLAGYNVKLNEGEIAIPAYKMTPEFFDTILGDIVEEVVTGIRIGYGKGYIAKLKPNWESGVKMIED